MEGSLAAERKMVLSTSPSGQAASFKAAGASDARLWEMPYITLQRRMAMTPREISMRLQTFLRFIGMSGAASLYKGRILHLKGRFFEEKGAIDYYPAARPRTRDVLAQEGQRVTERYNFFLARAKEQGHELTPIEQQALNKSAQQFFMMNMAEVLQGRIDAAYWLGLIEYEQGEYDSAFDYFHTPRCRPPASRFSGKPAPLQHGPLPPDDSPWKDVAQEYELNSSLQHDDGSARRGGCRGTWEKPATRKAAVEKKPEEKKVEEKKPRGEKDGREEV